MKRPALSLLLLLWSLSLVIAYFAGRQNASRSERELGDRASAAVLPTQATAAAAANEQETSASPAETSQTRQFTPLTLEGSLKQLNNFSPEQLEALIAQAMALPDANPKRRRSIEALLAQLAETDPLRALELADQIGSLQATGNARERILEVWASSDPLAALRWAEESLSQLPASSRHAQMKALLRGYASHDPSAAFDYVAALGNAT